MGAITGFTKEDAEVMRDKLILWREFIYDTERYEQALGEWVEEAGRFGEWVHCAVIGLDNLVKAFDCPQELMPSPIAPKAFSPLALSDDDGGL